MKYTVEFKDHYQSLIVIIFDYQTEILPIFSDKVKAISRSKAKEHFIPGYAPGKVPIEVVVTKFKDEILKDIAHSRYREVLPQIVNELGYANYLLKNQPISFYRENTQELVSMCTMYLLPSLEAFLPKLSFQNPKTLINDEDKQLALKSYQNFYAQDYYEIDSVELYSNALLLVIDTNLFTLFNKQILAESIGTMHTSNSLPPILQKQLLNAKKGETRVLQTSSGYVTIYVTKVTRKQALTLPELTQFLQLSDLNQHIDHYVNSLAQYWSFRLVSLGTLKAIANHLRFNLAPTKDERSDLFELRRLNYYITEHYLLETFIPQSIPDFEAQASAIDDSRVEISYLHRQSTVNASDMIQYKKFIKTIDIFQEHLQPVELTTSLEHLQDLCFALNNELYID